MSPSPPRRDRPFGERMALAAGALVLVILAAMLLSLAQGVGYRCAVLYPIFGALIPFL